MIKHKDTRHRTQDTGHRTQDTRPYGKLVISLVCALLFLWAVSGFAHAAITMTLDRNMIDFGNMNTGETKELAEQGVYHNEVTLTSTNNKTWYLKANMVRAFTSGMNTIPAENFKWVVVSVDNGKGIVNGNVNNPTSFSTMPDLIYTSADTDNTGTVVKLKFRYILTIPKNQVAGGYDAVIRLTMIETL